MKKIKMFAAAAMFCAAGFAGYTAYERATMTEEEKIFQANLEALTDIEGSCPICGYEHGSCGVLFISGEVCNVSYETAMNWYNEYSDAIRWCCDSCGTSFC